ncbi:hypothetical protein [Paraburkholderia sediminicola]|uniref:hypothetical protein n=1 Tax=Paraburkholderia sediminicola TaxID=458836 RepID=UPI0038B814FD
MRSFNLGQAEDGARVLYATNRYPNAEQLQPVHFVGTAEDGTPVVQWGRRVFTVDETELRMAPRRRLVYVNLYPRLQGLVHAEWFDDMSSAIAASEKGPYVAKAVALEIEE